MLEDILEQQIQHDKLVAQLCRKKLSEQNHNSIRDALNDSVVILSNAIVKSLILRHKKNTRCEQWLSELALKLQAVKLNIVTFSYNN